MSSTGPKREDPDRCVRADCRNIYFTGELPRVVMVRRGAGLPLIPYVCSCGDLKKRTEAVGHLPVSITELWTRGNKCDEIQTTNAISKLLILASACSWCAPRRARVSTYVAALPCRAARPAERPLPSMHLAVVVAVHCCQGAHPGSGLAPHDHHPMTVHAAAAVLLLERR